MIYQWLTTNFIIMFLLILYFSTFYKIFFLPRNKVKRSKEHLFVKITPNNLQILLLYNGILLSKSLRLHNIPEYKILKLLLFTIKDACSILFLFLVENIYLQCVTGFCKVFKLIFFFFKLSTL